MGCDPGKDYLPYTGRWLWHDPLSGCRTGGVLLSDRIAYYAKKIKLVEPFNPDNLRPASYDLTVGCEYYRNDKRVPVGKYHPIRIEPNELVYVRTAEIFNLPFYLLARYSLRVSQVYRGFMLDNGLQVDPGYHGHIYVPIYNFTEERRELRLGERFLSVDFTYTSPIQSKALGYIASEKQLLESNARGVAGNPIVFFKPFPRSRTDLDFNPHRFWEKFEDGSHRSNLVKMELAQKKSLRTMNRFRAATTKQLRLSRWISFGVVVATILAFATILYDHVQWTADKVAEVQNLTVARDALKDQVQDLQRRLETLESQTVPPEP